ncbi:MAG: DUF3040 domain-containing protein [Nakamurella sp.]
MSLSEEHRRALEEIERALEEDDPKFAATVTPEHFQRLRRRWVIVPAMLFLFGAVLLVTGLVTTHAQLVAGVIAGVIGFLAMPAAIVLFLHRHRVLMGDTGSGSSRAFG